MPRQPILSVLGHVDSGKCVAPETGIQLSDGSKIEAKDLFEEIRENGTRLEDKEGEVYRAEGNYRTFGFDDGNISKCNIEAAWKLEKEKLLEFRVKDGSKIRVTPEHPFLTVRNGELEFVEARNLGEDDFIAAPEKLPVENISVRDLKRNLLEKLSENERFLAYTTDSFAEKLGDQDCSEKELLVNELDYCVRESRFRLHDIVHICRENDIDLGEAYGEIRQLKQATLKQRAGSTSKKISLPGNTSKFEELAYFAGIMIGDGGREATKLYNNSPALRQEATAAVNRSLGVKSEVKTFEEKVDQVNIKCGKTLHELLSVMFDFPSESKSHSVSLSETAMALPENILANLISGYFDADGYVSKKGTLKITSASEEIIKDLKTALKRFGVSSYTSEKDGYFRLSISGSKNLENFTQIGFRHPEKKERFREILEESERDPLTGKTPVDGETVKKAREEIGASHTEVGIPFQKKYESYDKVSRNYLEKFVESMDELREQDEFRSNVDEKIGILKELNNGKKSRKEIYEKKDLQHTRILNHVLSLKSQDMIEKRDEVLQITGKGTEHLEKWQDGAEDTLGNIRDVAESDLEFIEIEEICEKEGGTVYDFSTEEETFVAEDLIVHNTTLLDTIRESQITEGEEGGITQMIGATEVPIQTVENVTGDLLEQLDAELTIPGILFIDTPGHAAFSSLRKRGGSISDIAILVVDVTEGIQPQTREALRILKESGTPFVIALNKIDTLHGWRSEHKLFSKNIKEQNERNTNALDEKIYELMSDLHEEVEVTADRFDRVDSFQEKVAIVPTSAETGEGIPELLMVVTGLAQNYLDENLEVNDGVGKGTILEVSQEKGLGTTLDVIHYDGIIRKDDKLVYGTTEGSEVTDIRALMEPRPLEEIRLDEKYERVEEVEPASGIKIAGKKIENAISGAPIRTASEEELDEAIEEVEQELQSVDFETQKQGVVVKADSLGSLEAVMRVVEDINVQKTEVGNVTKSDIIEVENEEPEERAILAFNTQVTDQARQIARDKGVEIFQSKVIYEIFENYSEWKQELQERQRQEALEAIPRPAKIRVIPDHVFNKSKPAVVGVKVVNGVIKPGSSIMTLDGEKIGRVKSVQAENDTLDKAEKGEEVAVSISNATVGRDFDESDELIVDISGREYRQLQELEDLLSAGEKDVLDEIVEIKDAEDPHWKIG